MSKVTSEEKNDNYIKDCATKSELGMLAVQLGTEDTSYKRPFTLDLLSNDDCDNANMERKYTDSKEDIHSNTLVIKHENTKFNEDYKNKLDNIRADLSDDEREGTKRSINLLELLDETE